MTTVGSTSAHAFNVTASNIEIEDLITSNTSSDAVLIDGASGVLIDRVTISGTGGAPAGSSAVGVHISGTSSGVTLQRSAAIYATGLLVEVDGSATGTTVSTDYFASSNSSAVLISAHVPRRQDSAGARCANRVRPTIVRGNGSQSGALR